MEAACPIVIGRDGFRGRLDPDTLPAHSGGRAAIDLEDGRRLLVPTDLLVRQDDGTYTVPLSAAELEQIAEGTMPAPIPIVEEKLEVGKRPVETGRVLITKTVDERTETADAALMREEAEVERVAVNRVVDAAPAVRREGDTLVIPVMEETLVVTKQLVLREEIRVTRRRTESHAPQEVRLRREEVQVRREPPDGPRREAPPPLGAGTGVAAPR